MGSLEKLSRAKSRRTRFEDIGGKKLHATESTPDEPPSVSEFIHDEKRKDMFADLVKDIDASQEKEVSSAALNRLATDQAFTQDDLKLFEKARYEYILRMREVEKIDNLLSTSEDFESVFESSEAIHQLVGTLPKDRAIEIMREALPVLAMKSHADLKDFTDAFNQMQSARRSEKFLRLGARTAELCQKNRFTEEEFAEFNPSDPESVARFRGHIRGNLKVLADFRAGRRMRALRKSLRDIENSEEMQTLRNSWQSIGNMLAATISSSEKVMKGITKEIRTKGAEKATVTSDPGRFASFDEVKDEVGKYNPEAVKGKHWERYKIARRDGDPKWGIKGDGVEWGDRPVGEQESGKNDYKRGIGHLEGKFTQASGLLDSFFAAMIQGSIGRIPNSELK